MTPCAVVRSWPNPTVKDWTSFPSSLQHIFLSTKHTDTSGRSLIRVQLWLEGREGNSDCCLRHSRTINDYQWKKTTSKNITNHGQSFHRSF
ncbi:hypothetical protein L2E82_12464 [Cichorium intybus]|uniref:Uncharacterized protein n=1 Tax=Cichorium intybus TaxID=13427 RepID=A0ACB9GG53_CICIN|nr:hypothetical protein L2E82_12464 [Cichorium intybus]